MKKYSQRIVLAALIMLSGLGTVQASLVAYGDFTTDTDTGLDWLDLDLTLGMSLNQVLAQTGSGGIFDGWQVATLGQIHLYMTHAGWVGPFDSSNVSNIEFVADFKALTTSLTNDPISGYGDTSLTDDPADTYGNTHFSDDPITGITSYSFTTPIDSSVGPQGTGTFLVRASAVPIPAAVWLFGSGLIGLVGIARRRRKPSTSLPQQQEARQVHKPLRSFLHRHT